ncbi:hypothetical protein JHK87_039864 [Glycine soja]|nr:hypothetical protein JHK87_039864 [Glycine soja]
MTKKVIHDHNSRLFSLKSVRLETRSNEVVHHGPVPAVKQMTIELLILVQVHPYTYRNEFPFLHFYFNQDLYIKYDYWIDKIGIGGLLTDFTGSLRRY